MANIYKDVKVSKPAQLGVDMFFQGAIKTHQEIIDIINIAIEKQDSKPKEMTIDGGIYWHLKKYLERCQGSRVSIDSIYINEVHLKPT